MMEARFVVLFCVLAAASNAAKPPKIKLRSDRPSLRLAVSETASIQCCYTCRCTKDVVWIQKVMISTNTSQPLFVNKTDERITTSVEKKYDMDCLNLILKDVKVNDTGLYQCFLTQNDTSVYTPGTFLQVYEPIKMILHVSESSKNSIITAEGVLLLLCVLLPGIMLICKSKSFNQLEKGKNREEENIYEGLNLDDCNSTYHQIQRSLVQGPYQDVINNDDEDIQLEKP